MAPSLPTMGSRRRLLLPLSALLVALTLVVLTLVAALGSRERHREAEPAFIPVTRGDLDVTITGRGKLEAINGFDVSCMVRARRQGDIIATTILWVIGNGADVKAGDTLVIFDDSAVRRLLQAQTLRVEQAVAEQEAAEKQFLLVQKKNKLAVPTPAIILEEATAAILAKAKVVAAIQEESLRQELLADVRACVVQAPRTGLVAYYIPEPPRWGVSQRQTVVALGEPVCEGQKLMHVFDPGRFIFTTKIHEALISAVKVGQQAVVRIDRSPDRVLCGRVKFVSSLAAMPGFGEFERKYVVRVELDPGLPGLVPAMKGTVRITADKRQQVLRLPLGSVLRREEKTVCFVKTGKGVAERTVKIGMGNDSLVEITHGLKEGELVLRDPQRVASRSGHP
jgi:HlyD family secretion protein